MPNRQTIGAIVLAAGRSTRMGEFKLLLPLGGHPLASYAVTAACASQTEPVVVVLGQHAEQMRAALPENRFTAVDNPDFAQGMSTSLRAGLAALPVSVRGVLILLADQPLITASFINTLIDEATRWPEAIIAASYAGQRGNPVYFPSALFAELAAIEGDEGGRSVIARHHDLLRLVPAPQSEQGFDIDKPEEYARLTADWQRYAPPAAG